ncbi:hypothetical protein Dimus_020481 [Dionaea muscipula]
MGLVAIATGAYLLPQVLIALQRCSSPSTTAHRPPPPPIALHRRSSPSRLGLLAAALRDQCLVAALLHTVQLCVRVLALHYTGAFVDLPEQRTSSAFATHFHRHR